MPPLGPGDLKKEVKDQVEKNKVMIFSKTTCPFCAKVKDLFKSLNQEYGVTELDKIANGAEIQNILLEETGQRTVPNVFINGNHLGGCDDTLKAHKNGSLQAMLQEATNYDYDLIVIGGGSGGLAASKEAASLGKKVAVFDFVKPTPMGTTWGLGGTCVNVGCIPKKLMHQAAILGQSLVDAKHFGWEVPEKVEHNWETMRNAIQDYIGSLNWGYRVQLRDKKVDYQNSYAEFIDNHTIKGVNKKGKEVTKTARDFIVAVGERPRYPDIPGAKEYGITSDDLFSLSYCPGKTLLVGASYVSLECGGFLHGIGLDVTVMVRSILLRGFDQQMANRIGDYMEASGINFIRPCVPTKIEKLEDGQPGKYKVYGKYSDGTEYSDTFNTVIFAIGRDPVTSTIGFDKVGVKLNKNGKVIADENEATNVSNIYAIGDILEGKLELTPVAIQAGKLLARRLYNNSKVLTDYINVATTVFTPLEYGSIGYSEEAAIEKFGEANIEVYHTNFWPLEWTVAKREENVCYAKIICHIPDKERVVGFHVCGPTAGEITQGYALGIKLGATKKDLDDTIGIHPTCSEQFTTLNVTKRSGKTIDQGGC
ncbi:thioredoxin reductase 1, cytoplasmic-like [Ylistrum balloti]|uniref:thioredoxin reductase 1, cytoplasmic-like n=1 Tax=Ylistrum balloti TaxID=509963 RepID=UPI002905A6B4|nr:thioredoxin reductase 1, cytoplasmic-like [Ylistrum balloti]XP_060064625.1 thioredoxin reductase 1, cytoplasmic-like [Ylistrum balloti]